jgi:hypothetical protein
VGITNVADIALFIAWGSVDVVRSKQSKEGSEPMADVERLEPRLGFADRPIVEVFISDETSFFRVFDASDSLYGVLEPFSKGYHRALVKLTPQASKPEDYRLLTQTDIVRFLMTNYARLDWSLLSQTVAEAGLVQGRKNLLCVTEDESLNVLQAFRRMTQRDMNCIGTCIGSGLWCRATTADRARWDQESVTSTPDGWCATCPRLICAAWRPIDSTCCSFL